jgi:hypothetical protein
MIILFPYNCFLITGTVLEIGLEKSWHGCEKICSASISVTLEKVSDDGDLRFTSMKETRVLSKISLHYISYVISWILSDKRNGMRLLVKTSTLFFLFFFLLLYHFHIYLHAFTMLGPPLYPPPSHPHFWAEPVLPLVLWFCWRKKHKR